MNLTDRRKLRQWLCKKSIMIAELDVVTILILLVIFVTSLYNEPYPNGVIIGGWALSFILMSVTSLYSSFVDIKVYKMVDDHPVSKEKLCNLIFLLIL